MAALMSKTYRNLAILSAIFVFLLILAGGSVRVTRSGLGCPDWPTCFGSLLPPNAASIEAHPEGAALIQSMGSLEEAVTAARIEYSHRIVASAAGLLILLTIGAAWLNYRHIKWIFIPANLIIVLMLIQVPLGGILVLRELEPLLVGVHLGVAFLILACMLVIAFYTLHPMSIVNPRDAILARRRRLLIATVALFIALMVGATVVGTETRHACPDWPLCNIAGKVFLLVPENYSPLIWYNLLHRYTIALYAILLTWVLLKTWRESSDLPAIRQWTTIVAELFAAQIALGAVQVWLDQPPVLRFVHLVLASAVWMALIILLLLHYLQEPTPEVLADKAPS